MTTAAVVSPAITSDRNHSLRYETSQPTIGGLTRELRLDKSFLQVGTGEYVAEYRFRDPDRIRTVKDDHSRSHWQSSQLAIASASAILRQCASVPVREEASKPLKRLLDPIERISEILFGLVMVLTVTCSFSVGGGGRTEVHQMLIGTLGCNVAWGAIDAVLYWLACLHAHGQKIMALRAVHRSENHEKAYCVIAESLPPLIASVMTPAEFETIRQNLQKLPEPARRPQLTKDEWLGGFGVFLLVVLATLPVVLPFVFVQDSTRALRVSNCIAVLLLFLTGYVYGVHTGYRPFKSGLIMTVIGGVMVGLTIALGG